MSQPDLSGVRDKIGRAQRHFDELNSALLSWNGPKDKPHSLTFQDDPDGKHVHILVKRIEGKDPAWPLIIGDILHNTRSALDHLVCQLAIANRKPISCCEQTFFPICCDENSFGKAIQRVQPLINGAAFARIKELQPYVTSPLLPEDSILWILSYLNIIDKHRTLVIVGRKFRASALCCVRPDGTQHPLALDTSLWCPLEDGTEIACVDFSPLRLPPEEKMEVKVQSEVQIFFDQTGLRCDGSEVRSSLAICMQCVREIVDEFEERFF
jgi:hypothetical protein